MEINSLGLQPSHGYPYSIIQSHLIITFRADPERLRRLFLTPPLKPLGDGSEGCMVFCDSMFPGLREVDGEIPDPNTTEFRECGIGMPAEYQGKRFYMWSWILLDHYAGALRRGFNRNVVDYTSRTTLHPLLEGDSAYGVGTKIHAVASNYGDLLARATFEATAVANSLEEAIPPYYLDTGEIRYLPDLTRGDDVRPLVHNASVQIMPVDTLCHPPLLGRATLEFGQQQYGLLSNLGPITVNKSSFITIPFTYAREDDICDLDMGWPQ